MKKLLYLIIGVAAMAVAACSNIDENDRLIYVAPTIPVDTVAVDTVPADSLYDAPVKVVARRVLIEDHTGQKCVNCPTATSQIHSFQETYGDLVVPVAIHSAMQGIMEPEGLGTELGNTYYNYWKLEYKPAGLISRMDGGAGVVMDMTIWPMALQYIATLETPLDIRLKTTLDENAATADIDVKVICTREGQPVAGKLQVWVTEDNIVAEQDDLNNVHHTDYVHNHVLRAAVNGDWGEDVSVSGLEDQKEFHYTLSLKSHWNPKNLAIVAFVYTDSEVVQATKRTLE